MHKLELKHQLLNFNIYIGTFRSILALDKLIKCAKCRYKNIPIT